MLDFYSELSEVHKEDYRDLLTDIYMYETIGVTEKEYTLSPLEATGLRETLKESAEEIYHIFLGITKWEFDKLNYEKAEVLYKKTNMGNAYLAILYELFKDREDKAWHTVKPADIRMAKAKVLILYMNDLFKVGEFKTGEDKKNFIEGLRALEAKAPKRVAKRIRAILEVYENYIK